MSLQSDILDHAGPTITEAESRAVGLDWYEDKFLFYGNKQWEDFHEKWDADNTNALYERPQTYYVWWTRTGDDKWRDRAIEIVDDYIANYLIGAGNNPSPHLSQCESLYLKWLIEGDTDARDRVTDIALNHMPIWYPIIDDLSYYALDTRIQTRAMMAVWMAEKINGSPLTITYLAVDYNLDNLIPRVLANQDIAGAWLYPISTCGFSQNFTAGMLSEFLCRIYDQRPAAYNADILAAMIALGEFLWSTQWRVDGSFNYISGTCISQGSATASPDLNGFFLPLFGWLGARTGDQKWFNRGDQILEGLKLAFFDRYKQFSEAFNCSFRYLGYRYPPSNPDPIFHSLADGIVPGQYYDF